MRLLIMLELFIGLIGLLWATPYAYKVIKLLPPGGTRRAWIGLLSLIVFFALAYLGYGLCLTQQNVDGWSVMVATVFMAGGGFVLLVTRLSLSAVEVVRRVAVLERENIMDPLMGVHNRRYFDRRLEEAVARSKRYDIPLSLLMIDVDHFKSVNDVHGHPCGDEVLAQLGRRLDRTARNTDLVSRYGGEEIAVLAPDTDLEGALVLAERLRERVAAEALADESHTADGAPLFKTISLGVAYLDAAITDGAGLVAAADAALYRAKHEGRDRVCHAPTEAQSKA
ncbi:GGDEF domain-containing protein [Myxococcota bacterium]|nr:GGDEF domain-containing protein [Myxococcota bacterium]MBU1896741.1 GGDEF domain-containing protein [Myxococcota bacterium]